MKALPDPMRQPDNERFAGVIHNGYETLPPLLTLLHQHKTTVIALLVLCSTRDG